MPHTLRQVDRHVRDETPSDYARRQLSTWIVALQNMNIRRGKSHLWLNCSKKLSYFIRTCGRGVRGWSRHCATRREDLVSIPGRILTKFSSDISLLSSLSAPGVHSACNIECEGISFGGKLRTARGADNLPSWLWRIEVGLECVSSWLVTGVLYFLYLYHPKL